MARTEEIKEKNQSKEVLFILLRMAGKSKSSARIRNPIGRCTINGWNLPINELNSSKSIFKHDEV